MSGIWLQESEIITLRQHQIGTFTVPIPPTFIQSKHKHEYLFRSFVIATVIYGTLKLVLLRYNLYNLFLMYIFNVSVTCVKNVLEK